MLNRAIRRSRRRSTFPPIVALGPVHRTRSHSRLPGGVALCGRHQTEAGFFQGHGTLSMHSGIVHSATSFLHASSKLGIDNLSFYGIQGLDRPPESTCRMRRVA